MAGFFTADEIAALRNKRGVRYAILSHLQFKTAPDVRLFLGAGMFDAGGEEWTGLGGVVQIDGLADQRGTTSNPVTHTLSGVDPALLPLALQDTEEVEQQPIVDYIQLMDDDEQPMGRLISMFYGYMQPPSIDRSEIGDEGSLCSITLQAENMLIGKSKPPQGRYTDRDQTARYPGDRFLERVAETKNLTVVWPDF